MIRQEVRQLSSRYADGASMYPGRWVFTWVKPPCLPWQLLSIEPFAETA